MSRNTIEILESSGFNRILPVNNSLDPPVGEQFSLDVSSLDFVALYSKNPGGGCSSSELLKFEKTIIAFCKLNKLPLKIYLHPRDHMLKFLYRHKKLNLLGHLFGATKDDSISLLVTSFSSALISELNGHSYLCNVNVTKEIDILQIQEYNWMPAIDLCDFSQTFIKVFKLHD